MSSFDFHAFKKPPTVYVHAVPERPRHAGGRTGVEEVGDAGGAPRHVHGAALLEDVPKQPQVEDQEGE